MEPNEPAAQFTRLCRELTRDWRLALDRRLRPFGLTNVQWLALIHLARADAPPTQVELAKLMGVEGPTMVRLLDRMEARGLVVRVADATDRRRKIIQLTASALSILPPVDLVGQELRRDFLAGVSAGELATAIAVLAKIRDNQEATLAETETYESDPVEAA